MNRRLIFIALIVALTVLALTAAAVLAGGNATGGNATGGNATGGNATGGGGPKDPVCVAGYDCPGDPCESGCTGLVHRLLDIFSIHDEDPVNPWAPGVQGTLFPLEVSTDLQGVHDDWEGDITVTFQLVVDCYNHGGEFVPSEQHPQGQILDPITVLATDADKNGKITVTEILNEIDVLSLLVGGQLCQSTWVARIVDIRYVSVELVLDNVDTPEDKGGNANTIEMFYDCAVDGHLSLASDPDSIECILQELNNPVPGPNAWLTPDNWVYDSYLS